MNQRLIEIESLPVDKETKAFELSQIEKAEIKDTPLIDVINDFYKEK